MESIKTTPALVELVVELSHYEEEGVALFPKILFCYDLIQVLSLVQGGQPIAIGMGPEGEQTALQALKRCAPLARHGWTVFIELKNAQYHYGVFHEPFAPTSIDLQETIESMSMDSPSALLIAQTAMRTVELIGTAERRLIIHISAKRTDGPAPSASFEKLINYLVQDAPPEIQEPLGSFLSSCIGRALVHGHGALIAVIPVAGILPTTDGIVFGHEICLHDLAQAFISNQGASEMAALASYGALIEGMLSSDGITIFRTNGNVVGYNFFIKLSPDAQPSELIGGARRRAFTALELLTREGRLACAFIRSSSGSTGHVEWTGANS